MRFFKDNLLLLTLSFLAVLTTLNSKDVLAGGDPTIKDKKIIQKKSNVTQHDHSKTYVNKQKKLSSKKIDTKSKKSNNVNSDSKANKDENVETAGFAAIEDVPLIVDLSSVTDSDGMGSVSVQWQISSDDKKKWTNISGATNQSFTPREIHVGSRLRVAISYVDGQGNLEPIKSPSSTPVRNVNDKPTGSARLIGSSVEDSALVVDTSSIADEDGIGGFDITWQRSSSKSSWEAYPSGQNEVLRLTQSQVGYSYRAVVSYIDSHGTREVLYTSPSETIDNLDDPVQGEITIVGEPKEGVVLRALSNSLSDEDGIASISISWETSKDGRNWVGVNSLSGPVLSLNQSLVGSQVRARVAVVDNFGIETNLYSQATRTVENVNNKPSGRIVIRRVGQ